MERRCTNPISFPSWPASWSCSVPASRSRSSALLRPRPGGELLPGLLRELARARWSYRRRRLPHAAIAAWTRGADAAAAQVEPTVVFDLVGPEPLATGPGGPAGAPGGRTGRPGPIASGSCRLERTGRPPPAATGNASDELDCCSATRWRQGAARGAVGARADPLDQVLERLLGAAARDRLFVATCASGSLTTSTAPLPAGPRQCARSRHTYKVEVIIEGENSSGMVVDFADLKAQTRASCNSTTTATGTTFWSSVGGEHLRAAFAAAQGRLRFPFVIRVWRERQVGEV